MTLAEKFELTAGRPAGFDYMRIILALAVLSWHTIPITYGSALQDRVWENPYYYSVLVWIIPAFFALSGFLVAGSLERCKTIAGFLYLRVIRIFPALIVEITVSALILGPLFTKFPIHRYFYDKLFYDYFLNCFGDIHFLLPGLFNSNPHPSIVNGQLWTVPYELKCYIIVAVLGILGITHRRGAFLVAVFLLFAVCFFHLLRHPDVAHVVPSDLLIMSFLSGVLIFNFRHIIPYSPAFATVSFLVAVGLFLVPAFRFLAPLPVAYVVVFLGLTNPRKIALLETGDYSYGIYLYGFPIQQAVVATGLLPRNGWIDLLVSLPLAALIAAFSWHGFEKHCLEMRRFRPLIDNWFNLTRPGKLVGQLYRLAVPVKL